MKILVCLIPTFYFFISGISLIFNREDFKNPRSKYELKIFELCQKHGIENVLFHRWESHNAAALGFKFSHICVISYNQKLADCHEAYYYRWLIRHEIGHILNGDSFYNYFIPGFLSAIFCIFAEFLTNIDNYLLFCIILFITLIIQGIT